MKNNHTFFFVFVLSLVLFFAAFVLPKGAHGDFATQQDSLGVFSVDQPYDTTANTDDPTVPVPVYNTSWLFVNGPLSSGPKVPSGPGAYEMRLLANNTTAAVTFSDGYSRSQTFWSTITLTGTSGGNCIAGAPQVELNWGNLVGVKQIDLYRADDAAGAPNVGTRTLKYSDTTGLLPGYNDITAANNATYWYQIVATPANDPSNITPQYVTPYVKVANNAGCGPVLNYSDFVITTVQSQLYKNGFGAVGRDNSTITTTPAPGKTISGTGWYNPLIISMEDDPKKTGIPAVVLGNPSATVQFYAIAVYDKTTPALAGSPLPIDDIEKQIGNSPSGNNFGFILAYVPSSVSGVCLNIGGTCPVDTSGRPFAPGHYYLFFKGKSWTDISSLGLQGYEIDDPSSGAVLFKVYPAPGKAWKILFAPDFQSRDLYTSGYVVDVNDDNAFIQDCVTNPPARSCDYQ